MTLKKHILILITLLTGISTQVHAQYVDTVCTGDAGVIYGVVKGAPSSFVRWFVDGGTITTDYIDSIVVDWGNIGGVFTIKAVEISLGGCDGDTVFADVNVVPSPDVDIGSDAAICNGETFEIDAGGGYTSYLWQDGNSNRRYIASISGEYKVTITNSSGCENSDSMLLTVNPLPYVNFGIDTMICNPDGFTLDAGNDGAFYTWFINGANDPGVTQNTMLVYPGLVDRIYSVEVTDEHGCANNDTITILYCEALVSIVVPTIITPNGDGFNDVWDIQGIEDFPNATVKVYSRWGNKVFESTGYGVDWDGTSNGEDLPMDSYYYVIDLHNGEKAYVGTITIVR